MRGWLAACATVKGLAMIAGIAAVLHLLARAYLVPIYREITGFVPFELQSQLSKFMIAVELGAFEKGAASEIYRVFAAVDFAAGIFSALLFSALWVWLFAKAPSRVFGYLKRGGIAFLPFYVVVLDVITKVGYTRLLGELDSASFAATIELCAAVHRLKFALVDIRNYATIALLLIAAVSLLRARVSRAQP